MSGRPPDQLAREVRERLLGESMYPDEPELLGERWQSALAALAELEAMASARNDDVSLLVGAYYGEVPSETMELAQAAARLRAAAAVPSPADQRWPRPLRDSSRRQAVSPEAEKRKPWLTILTPPNPYSKTGGRAIVLGFREYRSKWTTLTCFCNRARKDGTCKTLDGLVPLLAHPDRVRFKHDTRGAAR